MGEPELEQRQKAVPARQQLRLFSMSDQRAHGLV
jgi:hypothetical protein